MWECFTNMYTKYKLLHLMSFPSQPSVGDVALLCAVAPPPSPLTCITTQSSLDSQTSDPSKQPCLGIVDCPSFGFFWYFLMIKLCSGVWGRNSIKVLCPIRNKIRWLFFKIKESILSQLRSNCRETENNGHLLAV